MGYLWQLEPSCTPEKEWPCDRPDVQGGLFRGGPEGAQTREGQGAPETEGQIGRQEGPFICPHLAHLAACMAREAARSLRAGQWGCLHQQLSCTVLR